MRDLSRRASQAGTPVRLRPDRQRPTRAGVGRGRSLRGGEPIDRRGGGGPGRRLVVPAGRAGRRETGPGSRLPGVLHRAAGIAIYAALWFIDSTRLSQVPKLILHIVMTVLALIALRLSMQLALLHEKFDPWTGKPLLCAHCDRVVPDMPFCPACGVAERASSRASRRQRRESPLNSNLTRNPGRSV